ncbi:MAG: amidase [Acetobacteraceae bacterium]|nr:amidase [Acetobacteraceae bacterium]
MSDPARLTATEAAQNIRAGTLTPAALMEACLERVKARDAAVHAFVHLDPDQARAGAASARPGPLHGIPVGVKDVLDTADMPSQYGSPIWVGWQPRSDCAAVAATRAAGGVVMGKTVTTEFAHRHPGPTANPHNPAHTPGGSSSGSAASVADFQVPLAFGTQTAGSVIRPAAFCGIVGYKPSFGTISRMGMKIMSDSLDTVGVMARSVADCAFFAGAVSGRDLGNPDAIPERGPGVGLCRTSHWDQASKETQDLLARVAKALVRRGARVEERDLPVPFTALADAHNVVANCESAASLRWEYAHAPGKLSNSLRDRVAFGQGCDEATRNNAYRVFRDCQARFDAVTDGLDILLTPSAPGEAPLGLAWTGDPVFNYIWTDLHVPCVTVPAGMGPNGLPLGVQIVGRRGEDRQVLAWAQFVAAAIANT